MAVRNPSETIINGSVDNSPIGGTTPSTGTFTTITGQTANLKGTGENFLINSNSFSSTGWSSTITRVTGITDPFGGTNATQLQFASQYQSLQATAYNIVAGITYTLSIWVQVASGTRTFYVRSLKDASSFGTIVATTTWTRYSLTFTPSSAQSGLGIAVLEDDNASGFVNTNIYGAQLELGSVANTYVPTTSTAIYGTPTLNFSATGASIGLQNDGSLFVQPAGTGALQAQQTTSSATGGNARGANAVDWQTNRSAATQVASGSQSVLVGGQYNTSSGSLSFIGGGNANSATGFYNFIGGGYTNTGTSNSAVATQATSTITSGSTAVTLSGSNASIKVGQYITGTPIASGTYVSAISGTSLTLSQNATSSTNATLSFYTPHGVVVAGGNNQATGSYSFIGGGGDAGTAGNRNVASGDWSFVGGGFKNIATSTYDSVVGGFTNNAYGGYSFIGGGQNHNASSSNSSVLGGRNNTANQNYASIVGGLGAYSKSVCSVAQSGANYFSVIGDAQSAVYVLSIATTTTGATPLTTTQGSASTTNQVILPNNQAYAFRALITARNTSTGDAAMWEIKGGILRGSGVGTTALVGTPTVTLLGATTGAITAGWGTVSNVSAVADTTNGGLQITGTGVASTTIHWLARVDTSELG